MSLPKCNQLLKNQRLLSSPLPKKPYLLSMDPPICFYFFLTLFMFNKSLSILRVFLPNFWVLSTYFLGLFSLHVRVCFAFMSGIIDPHDFRNIGSLMNYMDLQLRWNYRIHYDKLDLRVFHDYKGFLDCLFENVVYFNDESEGCSALKDLLNDRSFDEENVDLIYFSTCLLKFNCFCRCRMAFYQ